LKIKIYIYVKIIYNKNNKVGMIQFYSNKENDNLKFKVNTEGINLNNVESRLILTEGKNKNYLIFGTINEGICEFSIPKLELFQNGDEGKVRFEMISEDLYFPVWEDNFQIKTKATIKVEEMIKDILKPEKKAPIFQGLIKEEKEEKKEEPKVRSEINEEILKKEKSDIENSFKDLQEKKPIKRFDQF
jgi:hypothetical protein